VAVVAVAYAWLGACTSLRMSVPADVEAESEVFEAKGRSAVSGLLADESFRLGPFAVQDVDRNATTGRESAFGVRAGDEYFWRVGKEKLRGGYTFRFTEGGETLEAECRTFTDRDKVTHFGLESIEETARLRCACQGADRTATLDLRLTGRKPSGSVVLAGQTFEMTSVTTANTSFAPAEPVGFRVDGADGPLGAVEVLHPGRVWLSKKLDPEDILSPRAIAPAGFPRSPRCKEVLAERLIYGSGSVPSARILM